MFLMVIFRTMRDVKLYLTYGRIWVENKYHGGNTNMVFVDKTLTVYELLVKVHEIVVVITVSLSTWKTKNKSMESPPIFLYRCDWTPKKFIFL